MVKSTLEFITLMAVHLSAWDRRGRARPVCVSAGRWSAELALTLRYPGVASGRVLCVWKEFRSLRWWRYLECWMNVLGKESIRIPGQRSRQKKRSTLGAFDCTLCSCSGSWSHRGNDESGEIFPFQKHAVALSIITAEYHPSFLNEFGLIILTKFFLCRVEKEQ